jgi:hypothetical protein
LDEEIEEHTQVLEDATIKRQKLTSLLEDNLIIRRNELTESSEASSGSRRSIGGTAKNASGASQAQLKEDLEQKRRDLEEATQTAEDVENQLSEVKAIDEKLRTEVANIKNSFDKLKTQDAAYQKELEGSHESQEKLLNKVCRYFVPMLVCCLITVAHVNTRLVSSPFRGPCASRSARTTCAKSKNSALCLRPPSSRPSPKNPSRPS